MPISGGEGGVQFENFDFQEEHLESSVCSTHDAVQLTNKTSDDEDSEDETVTSATMKNFTLQEMIEFMDGHDNEDYVAVDNYDHSNKLLSKMYGCEIGVLSVQL